MKRTVEIVRVNPGLNIIGQPHVITIHNGVAVSLTFTGTGGTVGKYVFALLSGFGTVPPGMTFADNGNGTATISGTPSAYGDYPITMTLENNGRAIKKSFILRSPELTLQFVQNAPVYAGITIQPGQLRLVASGGSGAGYTYSLATFGGFVDASTGYIRAGGTLPTPGTITDTATVIDSASNTVSKQIGIIVLPPLFLDCVLPTESEKGIGPDPNGPGYDFTFKVSGATGTVTWSAVTSLLGWSLDSATGRLYGSATATGLQSLTVRATDSGTGFSLDIVMPIFLYGEFKSRISPLKATIPVGVNTLVSAGFSGGVAPYTLVSVASAPAGLSIDMDPAGSAQFLVNASQAFAQTLVEANIIDALGVPIDGFAYIRLTAVHSINQEIQVRDATSDIGTAGPQALKFTGTGVTVTDTSDSSGNNERTIDFSGAQGPQGVQGATGSQGAQGAQGAQGTQGAQGATPDMIYGFTVEDDFLGGKVGTTLSAGNKSLVTTSGTGSPGISVQPDTSNASSGPYSQGVLRLTAGVTAGSRAVVFGACADGTSGILCLGRGVMEVTHFFTTGTTLSGGSDTYQILAGLSLSGATSGITDKIVANYTDSLNSGKWQIVVTAGGVAQTSANGVTAILANTTYHTRLLFNAAGTQVDLYVSANGAAETHECTYSGTMPALSVMFGTYMGVFCTTGTAGNANIHYDGWQVKGTGTGQR